MKLPLATLLVLALVACTDPTPPAQAETLPAGAPVFLAREHWCDIYRMVDDRGQVIYFAALSQAVGGGSCALVLGPQLDGGSP